MVADLTSTFLQLVDLFVVPDSLLILLCVHVAAAQGQQTPVSPQSLTNPPFATHQFAVEFKVIIYTRL